MNTYPKKSSLLMYNIVRKGLRSFFCFSLSASIVGLTLGKVDCSSWQQDFMRSFVSAYDINTSGRYAHEYHPYLLKQTSKSMADLESALSDSGMALDGRIVLMGYEENSFPRALPRISDSEGQSIDDEFSFFDQRRGWSIESHNKFGTMSGFLFRQAPKAEPSSSEMFQSVNSDCVEVFGLGLGLLQRYHFGRIASSLFDLEFSVCNFVEKKNWRGALQCLITFWKHIYSGDLRTEDLSATGTQDILFSVSNAEFIKNSPVELKYFYAGPDITYPITVSVLCQAKATVNAQKFLRIFIEKLVPIENENTVYIFRSFVDGVGKSTLLGNLKNYLRSGLDVEKYEPVDNTSTLEFELFEFLKKDGSGPSTESVCPKVFIADMPAQVSHFTYKPDGVVYVDLDAVEKDPEINRRISERFLTGQNCFVESFDRAKIHAMAIFKEGGFHDVRFFDPNNPMLAFARNVLLLKEKDNSWIPFELDGQNYIGNKLDGGKIKKLLPIAEARSEGLKNALASQMIFSAGVKFPGNYKRFLQTLVHDLAERGVRRVVFVDFLSMYSRSSRENIRLNFILQQMSSLISSEFFKRLVSPDASGKVGEKDKQKQALSFSLKNSFYRQFISECEILSMLSNLRKGYQARVLFLTEVFLRLALFGQVQKIDGILSMQEIAKIVQKELGSLDSASEQLAFNIVEEKVGHEQKRLRDLHSKTKEFLNVYSLDFHSVNRFSDFLIELFNKKVCCAEIQSLWANLDAPLRLSSLPMVSNKFFECGDRLDARPSVFLENGQRMRVCAVFSFNNKDFSLIDKVSRTMRSAWVFSISNLFFARSFDLSSKTFGLDFERVLQIPVVLKQDAEGKFWLLEKAFDQHLYFVCKAENIDNESSSEAPFFINLELPSMSSEQEGSRVYRLKYTLPSTAYGFFGFGHELADINNLSHAYFVMNDVVDFYRYFPKSQAISADWLWARLREKILNENLYWVRETARLKKKGSPDNVGDIFELGEAQEKNLTKFIANLIRLGVSDSDRITPDLEGYGKEGAVSQKTLQGPLQERAFDEIARILGTLQMILRDPGSTIVPHTLSYREFLACCGLIKFVSIPHYTCFIPYTERYSTCKLDETCSWRPVITIGFTG